MNREMVFTPLKYSYPLIQLSISHFISYSLAILFQ
ncbi:hypothetical protein YP516_2427 [Yersinia pestis Nepal516]|nr:hypothetical protein YP516_2427 [Yersinia pestis Nepal516]